MFGRAGVASDSVGRRARVQRVRRRRDDRRRNDVRRRQFRRRGRRLRRRELAGARALHRLAHLVGLAEHRDLLRATRTHVKSPAAISPTIMCLLTPTAILQPLSYAVRRLID